MVFRTRGAPVAESIFRQIRAETSGRLRRKPEAHDFTTELR